MLKERVLTLIRRKLCKHYWELAAIGGDISARYNLGALEGNARNHQRAKKGLLPKKNTHKLYGHTKRVTMR